MSLTPAEIIAFRKELRKGILDKSLDELRKAASTGDTGSQIAFLKIMFGQTAHTYNTYAGTMLTQLATLSYLQADPKQRLSETNKLDREFTVFSKDTLTARRLLLSRVKVPDVASSESIEAMVSFGVQQQAEEAERDKKEILRLRGEVELLKLSIKREKEGNAADNAKNASDLAAEIVRLSDILKKRSTETKLVAESKGIEGDVPEVADPVLNKSITMIEEGGGVIEWK